ncbi:unnamed protein product [Penicillium bialowiezense]
MHATYLLSALALALPVYSSSSNMGCYSQVESFRTQGPYSFQSRGYCEDHCMKKGFKVAALSRGTICSCGDKFPSESNKVDDDQCNDLCVGYPADTCGGPNTYNVIQVSGVADSDDSDSSSASTTAAPTAVTAAGGIVVAPSTAAGPTGIVTAASSANSKSANSVASKSAGSATTAATSNASPTPTDSAADAIRVGSPLIGAVIAGMGLLL